MLKNFNIKPPFFEVGPKAIIWGDAMLKLAKVIDKTAMKYVVDEHGSWFKGLGLRFNLAVGPSHAVAA